MSNAYPSKSGLVLDQQLVVQELSFRYEDYGMYSQSGSVVTVQMGPDLVLQIDSCEILIATGPSVRLNAPGNNAIIAGAVPSSNPTCAMQFTLFTPFAAGDVMRLQYRVQQ